MENSPIFPDTRDILIANEAGTIYKIVSTHYENAFLEVGNYLVKTFYDNDYARARIHDSQKKSAFSTLAELMAEK